MSNRTNRVLVVIVAVLTAAAIVAVTLAFLAGRANRPNPAPASGYASSYGPAEGCWIEATPYGPEKICGSESDRPVTA